MRNEVVVKGGKKNSVSCEGQYQGWWRRKAEGGAKNPQALTDGTMVGIVPLAAERLDIGETGFMTACLVTRSGCLMTGIKIMIMPAVSKMNLLQPRAQYQQQHRQGIQHGPYSEPSLIYNISLMNHSIAK